MQTREGFVTVPVAAEYASVTPRTVRRWIAEGRLYAAKTYPSRHGGRLRLRISDVEALLRAGRP